MPASPRASARSPAVALLCGVTGRTSRGPLVCMRADRGAPASFQHQMSDIGINMLYVPYSAYRAGYPHHPRANGRARAGIMASEVSWGSNVVLIPPAGMDGGHRRYRRSIGSPRPAFAVGTTLFSQPFHNNTADGMGAVVLPTVPPGRGVNVACLTAAGNSTVGPVKMRSHRGRGGTLDPSCEPRSGSSRCSARRTPWGRTARSESGGRSPKRRPPSEAI
jgi:hypothetical protein